jgi:hypothetical protein
MNDAKFTIHDLIERIHQLDRAYSLKQSIEEEVVDINFATTIPEFIKEHILEFMNELKSRQGYINPKYVFYTTPLYLMNLKLVAPIFESQTLFKKFWLKLSKISKNKTENLLDDFLGITCSLYCSLSNKSKNLSDLKKSEKICTKSHQLCELMCEYEQLYYMHARVPLLEAKDLINMIKSFDFNACSYNKRLQNNKIIKDFYYSVLECATNFQEQKDTDIWIPLFDLVKESLKIFSILTLKEVKMQREYNKQKEFNLFQIIVTNEGNSLRSSLVVQQRASYCHFS